MVKRAATAKKSNPNLNAGAAAATEASQDAEPPTPATPITPVAQASFNKAGQAGAAAQSVSNGQTAAAPAPAPTAPVAPQPHATATQDNTFGVDSNGLVSFCLVSSVDGHASDHNQVDFGPMDFANPMVTDNVLQDFDFDSFLHDNEGDNGAFDFSGGFSAMEGAGEIGAD
jgi:hypothetical protein